MPTNGAWIGQSPTYYIDQNGNVFDVNNPQNPAHPNTAPLGGSSGYKINPNGSLGWNNEQNDPLQIPMTRWSAFASGHYDFTDHVSLFAKLTFSQTKTSYESAGYSELGNIWAVTVPYNEASDDPASPTFGQVAPGGTITQLTQQVGEADIQGGLFDMPFSAGRLRYAFGVDYRSEDFNFNPDSGYNANQDTPVVVQNIALPVAVQGHTSVSEAYTEFSIPVVKDLPFVKSFEIDPGYRYSRYNTAGGVNTFKVMGDWNVTSWVKIRGGLEVANRAPNIAELFTPVGGSQLTGISGVTTPDPCAVYSITPTWSNNPSNPNRLNVQALCQYLITRDGGPASIMVPGGSANNYMYDVFGYTPTPFPYSIAITRGNPDLKSEVARTLTWGAVLHAPWDSPLVSKMSLSVDWYDIVLKGAIGVPGFNTVYQECLEAQYNTLVRRPYGSVTGAQMAANNPYCALSLNVIGSYLKEYAESPFAGAAYIDYTSTEYNNSFRYKLYTTLSYAVGPVSAGLRWTHLPSVAPPPGSAAGELGVDSHSQFDLFSRWAITDALELRGGIDNLFNTWPEWVGAIPGTNNAIGTTNENYDTIGRRFYLGLKAKF